VIAVSTSSSASPSCMPVIGGKRDEVIIERFTLSYTQPVLAKDLFSRVSYVDLHTSH